MYFMYQAMYLIDRRFKCRRFVRLYSRWIVTFHYNISSYNHEKERNISLTVIMYTATKSPCYTIKSPQQRHKHISNPKLSKTLRSSLLGSKARTYGSIDDHWARVKYMSKTTTMVVLVELTSLLFMYPRANRSLPVPPTMLRSEGPPVGSNWPCAVSVLPLYSP